MDLNFDFFNQWVHQNLGVNLSAYKERQMQRRIGNIMVANHVQSLEEYAQLLARDEQARHAFLEHITINVTEFYRNKELFDMFEQNLLNHIIPNWQHPKIWSAACSIGAEPYTLGMIMEKNHLTPETILATDIDDEILKRARLGQYKASELKNVPPADLQRYFTVDANGVYQVSSEIKRHVTFKKHDLLKDSYPTRCQAIICRNVTIYFKNDARDEVYRKLSDALVPGGILFVGATESINFPEQLHLKKSDSFIYQRQ